MRITLLLGLVWSQCASAATLRGRVADARTGEAIARARVVLAGTVHSTLTADDGAFSLTDVPDGEAEVHVTTVGYGLFKRHVVLAGDVDLSVALHQSGAARTDTMTVAAGAFGLAESTAPAQKTVQKSEIESLSMVLLGDPLRAAQALPGVLANNDFRAEFSVRGAGYNRVGVWVDGVRVDSFVHAASLGIGDTVSNEKLSFSIIDSNTVAEMTLDSGAYPATFGGSTAAVLGIQTRDGNSVRTTGRFVTGMLGVGGAVDGPAAGKKASWLLAGRSSYADYLQRLVERIAGTQPDKDEASLDFNDAQAKATYNLTRAHQVGLGATYGRFAANQRLAPGQAELERLNRLTTTNLLFNGSWRYTPGASFLASARGFYQRTESRDWNRNAVVLDDTAASQAGFRADAVWWPASSGKLELGTYVRRSRGSQLTNAAIPAPEVVERFEEAGVEPALYAQRTWRSERVSWTAGARVEASTIAGQALILPRASLAWTPAAGWTVRAGAGRHGQFPELRQLFGYFGNRDLRAETALHFNTSVERMMGARARILVEAYDREDRSQLFSLYEPRVSGGQVLAGSGRWGNLLRGHARGIEITAQRRSANRLAGWVSYAWMTTRYRAPGGLVWPGDFDQRHTFSAFGSYRFKPTVNASAVWRYGSGMPWVGFIEQTAQGYSLGADRNRVRLAHYSRLDLRVNKAFLFRSWKMTLSGEVLNVLKRDHYFSESTDPVRFQRSGRYSSGFERGFPISPSVSITVEF
jgi:outer membrane receptor for ferrienterochelin and colicin